MKNELKKFGLVMAGAFVVLGILFHQKNHLLIGAIFAVMGFSFAFFALALPNALKPIHFAWMKFSLYLGFIMSRVVLGIIFYLILTPISIMAKIFGKRFLDLKIDKNQKSYWHYRDKEITKDSYENQF